MALLDEEKLKLISLYPGYDDCTKYINYDKEIFLFIPNVNNFTTLYHFINSGQKLYTIEDILITSTENKNTSYTYILVEIIKDNTKHYILYARPIYTEIEVFGKHNIIFKLVIYKFFGLEGLTLYSKYNNDYFNKDNILNKKINILLSGELRYKGDNIIEYNFASGTFMKNRFTNLDNETIYEYSRSFENILSSFYKGLTYLYNPDVKQQITNKDLIIEEITDIWSKIKFIDNKLSLYFVNNEDICYSLTLEGKKVHKLFKQNIKLVNLSIDKLISNYNTINEIKYLSKEELINDDYKNKIVEIIENLMIENPRNKNTLKRYKQSIEGYNRYLIYTNMNLETKYPGNVEKIL